MTSESKLMNINTDTITKVNTNSNNKDEDNVLKLTEYDQALQLLNVKLEVL